jgi:hypothetical protein
VAGPEHLRATCEAIAAARHASTALDVEGAAGRRLVADCERRLGRYRAVLEAGHLFPHELDALANRVGDARSDPLASLTDPAAAAMDRSGAD